MGSKLESPEHLHSHRPRVLNNIIPNYLKDANAINSKHSSILTTPSTEQSQTKSKSVSKPQMHTNKSKNTLRKNRIQILSREKKRNEDCEQMELIYQHNRKKRDYDLLYKTIDNHFFMQTLKEQARNEIITSMSLYRIKENITLFSQGSPGNFWYVVHSGELDCLMDGKLIKTFKSGDSFGEMALMNDSPRSFSVVTKSVCVLWGLKRELFRKILKFLSQLNYDKNMKFLDSINLPFEQNEKTILANNLIQQIYNEGEYIFHEGEIGDCLYIIKEGEVECIKGEKIIRTLKAGDNFGQKALLNNDRRSLDVRVKKNVFYILFLLNFLKVSLKKIIKNIYILVFLLLLLEIQKFLMVLIVK